MSANWTYPREQGQLREDPRFAVIRTLPWIAVLRALSLEPRQRGAQMLALPCSFCGREGATIFFTADRRFRCRTCNRTGDAVDFIFGYAEKLGTVSTTAERAVRELAQPHEAER